jgi:hypothetical protein
MKRLKRFFDSIGREIERIWFVTEKGPFFLVAFFLALFMVLFLVGPRDQLYLVAFTIFLICFGSLANLFKGIWKIWKKTKL